jgi:putative ATPase
MSVSFFIINPFMNSLLKVKQSVFVLERLTDENVMDILDRAIEKLVPHQLPMTPSSSPAEIPVSSTTSSTVHSALSHSRLTPKLKRSIASLSDGDARTALSLLELIFSSPPTASEESLLANLRRSVSTRYDRTGDSHYDMISALHKSVRGSDGSAALYWLARMLTAGEDPLYIARRLIVMASEDIGLANNHALPLVSRLLVVSWRDEIVF